MLDRNAHLTLHHMNRLLLIVSVLIFVSLRSNAQVNSLQISPEKEKMYTPYMYWHHSGQEGLEAFKKEHPHDYLKELWYFCESWYILKDYAKEGVAMDPAIVDIERFEQNRKEHEKAILVLPGFKDAIVFLPIDQLIYRPAQK